MDISSFFNCGPIIDHAGILRLTTEPVLPPFAPQYSLSSQLLTSMGELSPSPSLCELEDTKRGSLYGKTMTELVQGNDQCWGGVEVEEEEDEEYQKRSEAIGRKRRRASVESQSMAARQRRMKIRDRTSKLGNLLPNQVSSSTTKLDTASMLDLAIKYLRFLEAQHLCLQNERTLFSSFARVQSDWMLISALLLNPQIQHHLSRAALCIVTNQQARFLISTNPSYDHGPFKEQGGHPPGRVSSGFQLPANLFILEPMWEGSC